MLDSSLCQLCIAFPVRQEFLWFCSHALSILIPSCFHIETRFILGTQPTHCLLGEIFPDLPRVTWSFLCISKFWYVPLSLALGSFHPALWLSVQPLFPPPASTLLQGGDPVLSFLFGFLPLLCTGPWLWCVSNKCLLNEKSDTIQD